MIDVVREVSAFKPIDLARIPEKYRPATEQMRSSFVLYNKALHEIQTGHDDAAKNYLRKAVAVFPEFYDAIMVLGILVFANGDRIGAVRIFNSVKDLEQRAVSIGILDHLVEEAERPESARALGSKKYAAERGKAESVMGGRTSAGARAEQTEAKYSRGQIFEKSSSYYEPQARGTYGGRGASSQRNPPPARHTSSQVRRETAEQGYAGASRDVRDFRMLNKYLLLIIAILLMYSIVVSTLLVNRMAAERDLKNKLEALSASSAPADPTPAPAGQTPSPDPGGTPPAGETGTPAQ